MNSKETLEEQLVDLRYKTGKNQFIVFASKQFMDDFKNDVDGYFTNSESIKIDLDIPIDLQGGEYFVFSGIKVYMKETESLVNDFIIQE